MKKSKSKDNIEEQSNQEQNTKSPENSKNTKGKKRGRKPILKHPTIIDPTIIENNTISQAKRTNKEDKNKRRLGPDVQYDLEENSTPQEESKKGKANFYDFLRSTYMLKDKKEYNLFEALNNANANISFAQLFAVSPSLRRLCSKGLKLNSEDIRDIKTIKNFDIEDEDIFPLSSSISKELNEVYNNDIEFEDLPSNNKVYINTINKNKIKAVQGQIEDINVKVLVDSGSDVNAINEAFYNKISDKYNYKVQNDTYFKMANNTVSTSNRVVDLTIKFGNVKIRSYFWILKDDDPCYDLILGRQSQRDYKLYLDPDDDGLYVKKNTIDPCIAKAIPSEGFQRKILKISLIDNINFSMECNLINNIKDESLNKIYDINKSKEKLEISEQNKLNNLLDSFKDILVDSIDEVKIAKAEPHSISIPNNTKPIKMRPYKISLEQSDALKEEIKKLLDHNLITPSHSPWAFPVLLVKKKNGKWRMCVDYRKLNEITIKDAYALPFIDELLESVHGATIFSALDLFSGYHQIPMNSKDIEKTAFTTKFGNYNFNVMPFGLTNAPASFQREMNRILMPLIGKCLFVYMDDILVYSSSFEQHLKDLKSVFSIFREFNFSINIDKCEFCKDSVEVLGHVLSKDGLKPMPSKVFAISTWKLPKNVTQLQSFLGLVGYYRKFIPNFAEHSNCLYKLTSSKVPFIWTSTHTHAFNLLRDSLCKNPILQYPDPDIPFIIRSDASSYAVGAVLLQKNKSVSDIELPVYYVSRCLKKAELNYSVTEKEGVAVIFALKKFRSYIAASKFPVTLFTDHKPLVGYFKNSIPLSDRHTRWISLFNEFKVNILYDKGKNNHLADALSRLPSYNIHSIQNIFNNSNLISDSFPTPLVNYVKKNFCFIDGSLVYKDKKGKFLKVVEDDLLKSELINKAHLVGHEGVAKTLSRIQEAYYWPGMRNDVEKSIKTCLKCQCYRPSPVPKGTSTIPTKVERPFARVGLDIIGPMPTTQNGNKFIIVLVDYFTKWIEASPLKNIEAKDVINFLKEVFSRHGVPEIIITDNGRQFIADVTKTMIDLYGSYVRFIAPRHPEANGLVENRNKEIEKILRHLCNQQSNWDDYLNATLWALRTTKSSVTGYSSFELLYGRKDLWPLSVVLPDIQKEENETEEEYNMRRFLRHQKWVQEAIENIQYAHSYWLQRTKSANNLLHKYKPGDLVLIRYINRKKLDPYFIGPFRVLKSSKYNTLVLETLDTKEILERNIHIKDVKPYFSKM